METSISKSELEDIYAPFKPPSKGSLEDRIRKDHPDLIPAVDELWAKGKTAKKLVPRDAAVTLLANRIANYLPVMDAAMDYGSKNCRIRVKQQQSKSQSQSQSTVKTTSKSKVSKTSAKKGSNPSDKKGTSDSDADKYRAYFDFDCRVNNLRDHQVLAIRRGGIQNVLKYGFEVDNQRAESIIARALSTSITRERERERERSTKTTYKLFQDAIHDAWARLIRKRVTNRLWKVQCQHAEERAIDVFCDNLRKALLAPPALPSGSVLVLDPGFKAGIKCAILDSMGRVESLETVKFLGSAGSAGAREGGKSQLVDLLRCTKQLQAQVQAQQQLKGSRPVIDHGQQEKDKDAICVVIGNGHGMKEARELVKEASQDADVSIRIEIVNEAGASVWSVTEMASEEFPTQSAAAVAAVSIGRRYQNPIHELVKIPPRSLGLGMYQHDLSEKDLDDKLIATSSDAVAEVGVDINACSLEILEKVPSLTKTMCKKIVKTRPLNSRNELLDVPGIGPKTFESCAAFVRVQKGSEPLDDTLVHPESYELAQWLLKDLNFELGNPESVGEVPSKTERQKEWSSTIKKGAIRYQCTEDRVLTVIEHLLFSITRPDPRLSTESRGEDKIGSPQNCTSLPTALSSMEALRKACPVRGVIATVRNVVDFGAFVDYGGENDGLVHRTKLGPVPLESLLIGQEIGIDILGVSKFDKVSVGLSNLNLPAEDLDKKRPAKRTKLTTNSSSAQAKRRRRS